MSDVGCFDRYEARVEAQWIDINDHANSRFYYWIFYEAGVAFATWLGLDLEYPRLHGKGQAVVESHTVFERELRRGDEVRVRSYLAAFDARRIHCYHELLRPRTSERIATMEQIEMHVDLTRRKSTRFAPELMARFAAVAADHQAHCRQARLSHLIRL